ncbi:MAG: MFS transporter [Candidatus Accumulibacter sp.]|jgi:EmrB/QacA subfamily drug resistance transporter|nr:MFS transporter [Accumulibacter sp.]
MKEKTNSRAIAFTVAAAFFMEMLDASIITTALPAIGAAFGSTALGVSASVTVYLVAMAVFVPAAGWCGERYGARRVFAAAVGVFTLASLLCGLAPSLAMLIAARVLQGAAAAFMSPVGRFVVLRETPQNRIIEGIATITWPGLIAPVLGPPLGGFIVSHVSWHWIFLINVPLGALGIWLVLHFIPYRPPERRAGFDAPGFVLTALALAALVQGLSELGKRGGGWSLPLGLIAVGLVSGFAAVRHARRTADPMLDLRALSVPTYALATARVGFPSRVAINASPFLLPLMFQIGFGMPPTQAGFMVLVYMVGNLTMKSATTAVLRRFGFRRVLIVNGALCVATLIVCGLLSPGVPQPVIYAALLAAGMTRSMNFTTVNTLAFADVGADQRAGASALATMLQQVAMTLGVAFAAFALGVSQTLRGAPALELADFRNVWFAVAALMALAAFSARRLHPSAGESVSGKRTKS